MDSPQRTPFHLRPAPRGGRLLAFVFDVLGWSGSAWAVTFALTFSGTVFALPDAVSSRDTAATLGALLYYGFQLHGIATRGQTLGKRMVGVRIVHDDTGAAPGVRRGVVLRTLVPMASVGALSFVDRSFGPALAFAVLVLDSAFLLGPQRLCLHDRLAGTHVLKGHPVARAVAAAQV